MQSTRSSTPSLNDVNSRTYRRQRESPVFRGIGIGPPIRQRAEISDDDYQTVISIPSAKKVVPLELINYITIIIVLLVEIIPVCVIGSINTLRYIHSADISPFLCMLALTGLAISGLWMVIRMATWRAWGQEIVTVDSRCLTIRYNADPWNRKDEYDLRNVQSICVDVHPRAVESLANCFQRRRAARIMVFCVWRYTTLRFRYGRRIVRFGREINREDAGLIREAINKRLGAA
jgi:hypothetical protein